MTNRKIQLTTVVDGQTVDVFPNTKSEFVEFADGKTLEDKINKLGDAHGHSNATPDKDGFMSKEDKAKLDNVTNYTHPSTHAATMITEDATHRFVTDAEKTKWNNKADTTMASKTNAGLMSASDKQRIDGLNAEFKTRDDKITKNTEDIKSWNDEMINKEYQYFNGQDITIDNSIVSKTTDMVIKGKTFQNIIKMKDYIQVEGVTRKEGNNFVINKTMPAAKAMSLHKDKIPLLKPNTTYTVMANITNNNMTKFFNLIHCYETIMLTKNDVRVEARQNGSICKTFTTIDNLNDGSRFEIIFPDDCTGSVEIRNMMIFEGDLTSIFIDEYFEGIRSFGEIENKIKLKSSSKNIFKSEKDSYVATPNKLIQVYDNVKDLVGIKTNGVTFKAKISMSKDFVNDNHFGFDIQFLFSDGTSTWSNFTKGNGLAGINPGDTNRYFSWFCNFGSVKTISSLQQCFIFTRTSVGTLTFSEIQIIPYKDINNEEYEKACTDEKEVILPNNFTNGLMGLSNTVYDEANNISKKFTKRISKMEFNGNENNGYSIEDKGDNWKFGIRIPDAKPESTVGICNTFANVSSNMDEKTTQGFRLYTHNPSNIELRFAINKRILNTGGSLPTNNDIKNFFKNNPTVVFYELNNPIEIDFKEDLNLKTFNKITYIKTDDFIKANINFTVAMNTAANLDINSLRLNDVENFVKENKDNKNKISKLEEGAVASSLNIVDLQKDIKNENSYNHYEGTNLSINGLSKENRTSNLVIKGETIQNLFSGKIKDIYNTANIRQEEDGYFTLIKRNYGDCIHTNISLYKPNTKYTLIVDVKENTLNVDCNLVKNDTRTICVVNNSPIIKARETGITKHTFTTISDFSQITGNNKWGFYFQYGQNSIENKGDITLRFILLEGDWTDKKVPSYFEGIKSIGESENNYLNLISENKNLFNVELEIGNIAGSGSVVEGQNLESDPTFARTKKAIICEPNTEYSVSLKRSDIYLIEKCGVLDKDDGAKKGKWILFNNNKGITTNKNIYFKCVIIRKDKKKMTPEEINSIEIQLEKNNLTTSYITSNSDNKKINLKLLGLSNGIKRLNTNIFDEINSINELAIERVGKIIINGYTDNGDNYIYYPDDKRFIIDIRELNINKKDRAYILCDKMPYNYSAYSSAGQYGISGYGDSSASFVGRWDFGETVTNRESFIEWLKNNPITIYYELENPIIKSIKEYDFNLTVYKEYSHIYTSNNINGELSFDLSNNLSTQNKENTKNINTALKEIDILNNKSSKLETAQLSTALNVLELQKHTSMLDNGEIDEYKDHVGNFIRCDNTLNSRTENMIIKGQTFHNIQKKQNYSFPTNLNSSSYTVNLNDNSCEVTIKNYESGKYYYISGGLINFSLLKPNTVYSIIANATDGLNPCIRTPSFLYPLTKTSTPFINGVATITTNDLSAGYKEQVLYVNMRTDMLNRVQYLKNAMILEGDWTNKRIPFNYFEGIKSTGEAEYNILNENQISIGYIGGDGGNKYVIPSHDDGTRTAIIPCESNMTYTITKEFITDRFVVATSSQKPTSNMQVEKIIQDNTAKSITITTLSDAKYLLVYLTMNCNNASYGKVNINKSCNSIKWSVPGKYNVSLLSHGKNIFNFKTYKKEIENINGITFQKNGFKIDSAINGSIGNKVLSKTQILKGYFKTNTQYFFNYDAIHEGDFQGSFIYVYTDGSNSQCKYISQREKTIDYIGFTFLTQANGGKTTFSNFILIEGENNSNYELYKENRNDILLSEPLRKDDYLYEDNMKIKVYRESKEYILTGIEDWNQYNDQNNFSCIGFYLQLSKKVDAKLDGKFICSHFKSNDVDVFPGNITIDDELIFVKGRSGEQSPSYIKISILKSKLSTQNVEGFKAWLKDNPIKVIYQLANPVVEIIDFIDINVDTYKDKTYVVTDNEIQGELEFKTQNNFGAIMKNVNRCISKIFNSLNNILNIKGE